MPVRRRSKLRGSPCESAGGRSRTAPNVTDHVCTVCGRDALRFRRPDSGRAPTAGICGAGDVCSAADACAPFASTRKSTCGVVQPLASTSCTSSLPVVYPSGSERGSSRKAWRPGRRFVNENFPVESLVATRPSSVQSSTFASHGYPDYCTPSSFASTQILPIAARVSIGQARRTCTQAIASGEPASPPVTEPVATARAAATVPGADTRITTNRNVRLAPGASAAALYRRSWPPLSDTESAPIALAGTQPPPGGGGPPIC